MPPLTNAQAAHALANNPEAFLRKTSLFLTGDMPASGVTQCRIDDTGIVSQRPGSILRTKNMHAAQMFMAGPALHAGTPFNAHWIKMHVWNTTNDLVNIQPYLLPLGGPAIMLTTQLTGCSFAIQDNNNGTLSVLHLQPSQHADGATMHTILSQTGWTKVYGRNNYVGNGRSVSIVGRRSGGQWRLWAQKQDRFNQMAVLKVKQIYP